MTTEPESPAAEAERFLRDIMVNDCRPLSRGEWESVFRRLLGQVEEIEAEKIRLAGLSDRELWEEMSDRPWPWPGSDDLPERLRTS